MNTLAGKTLFITGASRGIGLAIALRAARDGANIAIAAKSAVPNPTLPGTSHSAALTEALSAYSVRANSLRACETLEAVMITVAPPASSFFTSAVAIEPGAAPVTRAMSSA